MLQQLTISSFAIVDRLSLTLGRGLNILTGETGAGKSIVVDAVGMFLGSRLGPEFVRTGAEQAQVEGIFDVPAVGWLFDFLAEHDLVGDPGSLIVSRTLGRSGRSVARINGRAVPLAILQEVGRHLVDIHGQSEHLSLLRVAEHVDLLDGYAGTRDLRGQVAARYGALRQLRRELDALQRDERELARRVDLLRFQVEEIHGARLLPEEEEGLRHERHLLANAERLSAAADAAYRLLYEGGDDVSSATDLVGRAAAALGDLGRLDPAAEGLGRAAEEAAYQLEDVARELRAYRDQVEHNPERLEDVEERLELIQGLKRKYGASIPEVLQFAERASAELDGLGHREERLADLQQREADALVGMGRLAQDLSAARRAAAASLAEAVESELADLGMARSRFRADVQQAPALDGVPFSDGQTYACDATGADRVEFMISTNPGEPEKPLARIASGGETSRLMLALKTILARADLVPVLIFDEIDVGIGGRSGHVVAEKLAALARERQVICVTHLPQIACFGDAHFGIAKAVSADRTTVQIRALEAEERVAELALMLGGTGAGDKARANASELLDRAAAWKRAADPPPRTVGARAARRRGDLEATRSAGGRPDTVSVTTEGEPADAAGDS